MVIIIGGFEMEQGWLAGERTSVVHASISLIPWNGFVEWAVGCRG